MDNRARTRSDNWMFDTMSAGSSVRRGYRRPISGPRSRYMDDVRSIAQPKQSTAQAYKPKAPSTPVAQPPVTNINRQLPKPIKKRKFSKLRVATLAVGTLLILAGGYVSLIGWKNNHIVEAQASKLTQQANNGNTGSRALVTKPPSSTTIANYYVAPNLPRYLNIPSLSVHARVLSVGINSSGALETPGNVFDTAWYNESAQPGQPGAMLIDGHISSWTAKGVFYGLDKLTPGDTLQIVRGDGTVFNYQVVKTQTYGSNDVDMSAAMTPVTAGKPGLNLISCSGDVVPGTSEFNKRIIVFTEQVN